MPQRFKKHLRLLNANKHPNQHLQNAWNKHGSESFRFRPILECAIDDLLFYEQRAIDINQAANREHGYNKAPIAGCTRGIPTSAIQKAAASAMLRDPLRSKSQREAARVLGKRAENIEMLARYRSDPDIIALRIAACSRRMRGVPRTNDENRKQSETKQRHRTEGRVTRKDSERKLTPEHIRDIRLRAPTESMSKIGGSYGVAAKTISHILSGKSYAWVT